MNTSAHGESTVRLALFKTFIIFTINSSRVTDEILFVYKFVRCSHSFQSRAAHCPVCYRAIVCCVGLRHFHIVIIFRVFIAIRPANHLNYANDNIYDSMMFNGVINHLPRFFLIYSTFSEDTFFASLLLVLNRPSFVVFSSHCCSTLQCQTSGCVRCALLPFLPIKPFRITKHDQHDDLEL